MTEEQRLRRAIGLLCDWYHTAHRSLPWRSSHTYYHVWVSEVMLQQTRVQAVIPYYERFMAALPSVQALAAVPEDQLMKLWEGLGYYSRARNLQKAAQIICRQYGGEMPRTSEELRKLPGIGSYTAGAIASIAGNEVCPAVDGNVLRVMSRLLARSWDIKAQKIKRQAEQELLAVLLPNYPGDCNQALMELGAMICLPNGVPLCAECPIRSLCLAFAQEKQKILPVKIAKKPRPVECRVVYLLWKDGRIALKKRPSAGLLAGMWEFPNFLAEEDAEQKLGVTLQRQEPLPAAKHVFTHLEWKLTGVCAQTLEDGYFTWVSPKQLEQEIALPSAFRVYRSIALQKEA